MPQRIARFTPRQREIYDFIRRYTVDNGFSPSLMEIRDHLGLTAVSTVHEHLVNMEEKGFLKREEHAVRSATVAPMVPAPAMTLPLLGHVAAGPPTESYVTADSVVVPGNMVGRGPHYGLRVLGESMRDEHILPGDVIVVRHTNRAERGDLVIAIVEGTETTVKRYFPERNHIRLQPSNRELKPIRLPKHLVQVQGLVVGVLRQYGQD